MNLIRFWIRLDPSDRAHLPGGITIGFGVTAYSQEDAVSLLRTLVFADGYMPAIVSCQDNVDIRTLDAGHVLPNMYAPNRRGIWFPMGYQFFDP